MLLSILLTEYSVMFPAEQLFFLFIALCLMQNPIGWCCDWLKIPELARGILSQSQYQWLVRAILHQAQGVFPVFVFLAKTRVSWCHIIYKVFSFHWVTRPRATCGTLRFQWKVTWVVSTCRFFLMMVGCQSKTEQWPWWTMRLWMLRACILGSGGPHTFTQY